MNLIETLQKIIGELEVLNLKEASAEFTFSNDGIFGYEATTNLSMFSSNEPTKIDIQIIADDSFLRTMPILDILNSKRIHFIQVSFMHQDEKEENLDVHFDDNWYNVWSIMWRKEPIVELN